jgi:GT2 family glycosyltransferase
LIPNRWQPSWSTHWDHGSSREIQGAAGVAMLVRSETWARLGGFDERIYFYAEDFDLCLRTRRGGWKVWFCAEAEFVHLGHGSTANRWASPERCEMIGRSEGTMIRRNLNPLAARLSLTFINAGLFLRYAFFRLARRPATAAALAATLRGFRASAQS